jgi:2-polyprenyl-3-methyl-5-hydroxy-6-metoxy-1,4-benzoquinol methylase
MESEPPRIHAPRPLEGGDVSAPQVVPTREGYDLWAHTYDEEDNSLIALETRWIRGLLGEVRGLMITDIGCGTGRHALAMAAAGLTSIRPCGSWADRRNSPIQRQAERSGRPAWRISSRSM